MMKYILLVLTLVLNTSFSTAKAEANDAYYFKKLSEEAINGNEQAMNKLLDKAKQGNADAQYFVAQIVLGDGNDEDGINWLRSKDILRLKRLLEAYLLEKKIMKKLINGLNYLPSKVTLGGS